MKQYENLPSDLPVPPEFRFVVSATFAKEFKALKKKYPSIPADVDALKKVLTRNPDSGEPLGRDCFKIRVAITSKQSGKSGGGRVITCVKIVDSLIYLLSIYDKSEQETIADGHLTFILKSVFG